MSARSRVGCRAWVISLALWLFMAAPAGADTLWVVYTARDSAREPQEVYEHLRELLRFDRQEVHLIGPRDVAQRASSLAHLPACLLGAAGCNPEHEPLLAWLQVERVVALEVTGTGREVQARVRRVATPRVVETLRVEHDNLRSALLYLIGQLAPVTATLRVESDPPGATVLVEGEARGTTPLEGIQVPAGQVHLRLTREGYGAVEDLRELRPGEQDTARYALPRRFARLELEVAPRGAEVVLLPQEGQTLLREVSQGTWELAPGEWRMHITAPDHEPWEETLRLGPAEDRSGSRTLRPTAERVREERRAELLRSHLLVVSSLRLSLGAARWRGARSSGQGEVRCVERAAQAPCEAPSTWGGGADVDLVWHRGIMEAAPLGLALEKLMMPDDARLVLDDGAALARAAGGWRGELRFLHVGGRLLLGSEVQPYLRIGPTLVLESIRDRDRSTTAATRLGVAGQARFGVRWVVAGVHGLDLSGSWLVPLSWREEQPRFVLSVGYVVDVTGPASRAVPQMFSDRHTEER